MSGTLEQSAPTPWRHATNETNARLTETLTIPMLTRLDRPVALHARKTVQDSGHDRQLL
jgi:hypothetical protein